MLKQYRKFNDDEVWRGEVIMSTSLKSGLSEDRVAEYFSLEVENHLDSDAVRGLELFLSEACDMVARPEWVQLD
jgi:predicted solute-binding protein